MHRQSHYPGFDHSIIALADSERNYFEMNWNLLMKADILDHAAEHVQISLWIIILHEDL